MNTMAETEFRYAVFEGLLYLASDRGVNPLPSMWEFITSEIIGGTYEYVTDTEFKYPWRNFRNSDWVNVVNKHIEILDGQNKFNPALAESIKHWTLAGWSRDHGECWWDNQIRFWFLFGGHIHMQSTFALTVPQAREIEADLASLDPDTRRHMENIAEIMKKYLKEDIEHIRAHYHW